MVFLELCGDLMPALASAHIKVWLRPSIKSLKTSAMCERLGYNHTPWLYLVNGSHFGAGPTLNLNDSWVLVPLLLVNQPNSLQNAKL